MFNSFKGQNQLAASHVSLLAMTMCPYICTYCEISSARFKFVAHMKEQTHITRQDFARAINVMQCVDFLYHAGGAVSQGQVVNNIHQV